MSGVGRRGVRGVSGGVFRLGLVLLLLLTGCTQPSPAPAPTPAATAVPPATSTTPVATPTPQPTAVPPATQPPTHTPTPWPALPTFTPVPTPVPGVLYVDPQKMLGPISRFSYGTNYGPWSFLTEEARPYFLESGVTFIRFPGGNFGDENNLELWHVDLFIAIAKQIGAEPQISVRLLGGSPEQAVSLLKYTQEKGHGVRYWSIGNEPNLYAPRHPEWDTEYFNKEWRKFALALKAADPEIKLIGPETNQFTGTPDVDPTDAQGRDWLREFLRANGDLVDVVSVHRYPFPARQGDGAPAVEQLFADAPRWDSIVANLRSVVREETGRDLPIAITEWNSSWANNCCAETTTDSVNSAVWLADVLGRQIRGRLDLSAQFALISTGTTGSYGLLARDKPRPSFYVYKLYRQFGDELLQASSDDPAVSVYAARRKDGALTLIITNLSTRAVEKPLVIAGLDTPVAAETYLFDASHAAEAMPPTALTTKTTLTLPPASVTLLVVP